MIYKTDKNIVGIKELLKKLPEHYHSWHHFGNVLEFKFAKEFDYEDEFDYVRNIEMVLESYDEKYRIRMKLKDVNGLVSFDVMNGFFSGFQIEYHEQYERWKYELSSFEQDIYFELYCAKIYVELID